MIFERSVNINLCSEVSETGNGCTQECLVVFNLDQMDI